MIGRAAVASAVASATLCTAVLGGARDPGPAIAGREMVLVRADAAAAALDPLDHTLGSALDAAREGAARVAQGDARPGTSLERAADLVAGAVDESRDAQRAMGHLDSARRAQHPDASPLPPPPRPDELATIAAELRTAAAGADAAADLRTGTTRLLEALDDARAALASGDVAGAREATDLASAEHASLSAVATAPETLPLWLDATGAMITVVTTLIDATEAGDLDAIAAAQADLAALAEEAGSADRALDIALADAAAASTGPALARLATSVAEVADAVAAVAAARVEGAP